MIHRTRPACRGRSPLTRGRRKQRTNPAGQQRSIPAHAGETTGHPAPRPVNEVDPRSRGGDSWCPRCRQTNGGRSPLTRGRRGRLRALHRRSGSIPAHAGETHQLERVQGLAEVDPRSRGGDPDADVLELHPRGRSPLTRGRRSGLPVRWLCRGSIPAHAGETPICWKPAKPNRVDPRSRGGDDTVCRATALRPGRSPLTRGRRADLKRHVTDQGSIPAHAGETPGSPCRPCIVRVDPRSRGGD